MISNDIAKLIRESAELSISQKKKDRARMRRCRIWLQNVLVEIITIATIGVTIIACFGSKE